ncbi:MAG TPA: hypothetical protein PK431_01600 [Chitinophagales bacterium]|nr:hypothetical protein [Chitinophagales bacterium]
MARDKDSLEKRDNDIRKAFAKLSKGRCHKWKREAVVKELADMFYLSAKRVSAILLR